MANRSVYFESLSTEVKQRYEEKLIYVDNFDPYCINLKTALSQSVDEFPNVSYIDLVNYLLFKKSAYTQDEFKAYKSLEAYNAFACGWIRHLGVKKFNEATLIMGKVLHSQRLNERPFNPWVIAKTDGEVLCGHCDCVAGLGEACTHVAALLFAVEHAVRNKEEKTVTDEKAYWKVPSGKPGQPSKVKDINFATGKQLCNSTRDESNVSCTKNNSVPELSDDDVVRFLEDLEVDGCSSSLHSIGSPFCDNVIKPFNHSMLTFLYKPENETLSLEELRMLARDTLISVSPAECVDIEKNTRGQSSSNLWFAMRAGRITASKFKAVCYTNIEKPSISLLRSIRYPKDYSFSSLTTKYGCTHEKDAIKAYCERMKRTHQNFELIKVGLVLNSKYPFFGASPDSLIQCDCCGQGCLEVKYCADKVSIDETIKKNKKFYLTKKQDGTMELTKNHQYFYQVQMQLALTERTYCDFVVWSKEDFYCERITVDTQFWSSETCRADEYFRKIISPELLGKYFTKQAEL